MFFFVLPSIQCTYCLIDAHIGSDINQKLYVLHKWCTCHNNDSTHLKIHTACKGWDKYSILWHIGTQVPVNRYQYTIIRLVIQSLVLLEQRCFHHLLETFELWTVLLSVTTDVWQFHLCFKIVILDIYFLSLWNTSWWLSMSEKTGQQVELTNSLQLFW